MTAPLPPARPIPDSSQHAWAIWRNPIFKRYVRSRLRPQAVGVSLILVLVVAGFLFFIQREIGLNRTSMLRTDAERLPIISLFVLQAVILFVLGTGQVAGGMTAEKDEGVLDYQRLIPLSPLTKVLGYLFGLPLREYVMFLSTLPFTAWCLWQGEVEFQYWGPLYAVLISATLLYHLTGLVAGTVIKNRRWAFLAAIFAVFLLYSVIPQLAKFGLTTFKYFTIWPVLDEVLPGMIPSTSGRIAASLQRLAPEVRFFGLRFSELVFSMFAQGVLILTFVVMLWRRWSQSESHLLGKVWAVGLFAWTQLMLLGNALPLIAPGFIFPSQEFGRRFMNFGGNGAWRPQIGEATMMMGIYCFATLLLILVLAFIITPTKEHQLRAIRRSKKLAKETSGRRSGAFFISDAASSFWFVLAMSLIGAAGCAIFATTLSASPWFNLPIPALKAFAVYATVLVTSALCFQTIFEIWGGKQLFLAIIFVGLIPTLTGTILFASSSKLATAAVWIASFSPSTNTLLGGQMLLGAPNLPLAVTRAVPPAFTFSQGIFVIATLWLVVRLWKSKKARGVAETPPA